MKSSMVRYLNFALFIFTLTITFNNCSRNFSDSYSYNVLENIYGIGQGSTLENMAVQVLQNRCANCHSPPMLNGGIIDIADVPGLLVTGMIIPGYPDQSKIYTAIKSNKMPKGGPPLPPTERELIQAWLLGASWGGTDGGNPSQPAPTFAQINSLIFQPKCVTCHNATNASGNYNFSTYNGIRLAIIPGNPAGSPVFQAVSAGRMPKQASPLTGFELQQLADWIAAGAIQ